MRMARACANNYLAPTNKTKREPAFKRLPGAKRMFLSGRLVAGPARRYGAHGAPVSPLAALARRLRSAPQ
jgi:hypothetical protein